MKIEPLLGPLYTGASLDTEGDCSKTVFLSNFAELTQRAKLWDDLSKEKRDVMCSHIRTVGLAAVTVVSHRRHQLGVQGRKQIDLRSVPVDVAWLNNHIFDVAPKAIGMKNRPFGAAVSDVRVALRRVGLLETVAPKVPAEAGQWRYLLDTLSNRGSLYAYGLTRFAGWCHRQGIEPAEVTEETLVQYEAYLRSWTLRRDISSHIGNVAKAWRMAARMIDVWPNRQLLAPVRREAYVLALDAYPESFQHDVSAYTTRLSGGNRQGPFRGDGPRKLLRPKSVASRLFSIRQAAVALVLSGRPISSITCLADLVGERAFEEILHFYWKRMTQLAVDRGDYASIEVAPKAAGVTSMTGSIATTLMGVARHYCKLPNETCERLAEMAADVTPPPATHISSKNLARVRQFDDAKARLDLLALPERLMKMAETEDVTPVRRAILARTGLAIEILLNAPVRLENLVSLKFGVHLRHDGSRQGRITHLYLAAHETKNTRIYETVIDPQLAWMIRTYLSKFHPALAPDGSSFLFPADRGKIGHLSHSAMYSKINSVIEEEAGSYVNPNLFRHLAVRFILEDDPNALEDARQILGDKSMGIVLAHYASVEPAAAARRHHERLRRARRPGLLPKPPAESKH